MEDGKIMFFVGGLGGGGKERRVVELLKHLNKTTSYKLILVLTKELILYEDIFELNIKIHIIPRKILKKDPTLFFKFILICLKEKPNIIHVWDSKTATYAIPAKLLINIPMINSQITNASGKIIKSKWNTKLGLLFSDLIIANSKAGLKSFDAPESKSIYIHNGFDFKRTENLKDSKEIRYKFHIKTKYIVCMIGSFTDAKDYTTFIQSANNILENRQDISFLCIGSGDDTKYKSLIEQKNNELILFLGRQKDIENIISICDIGIKTTNDDKHREGIPNTIMEFMAFGKPVIATNAGGTKELVVDNNTGFLISPKSPEILSEKITILLEEPLLRKKMGKCAKKRIMTQFNINIMTSMYVSVYKKLLSR